MHPRLAELPKASGFRVPAKPALGGTVTIFDSTPPGPDLLEELAARAGSKQQLIGVLLLAYGAAEGALVGWMSLMTLQGANGTEPWLRPTLLGLAIPCCVVFVGQGLARDRRWAYWAALLLPLMVVPVGVWWIMNPGGRPERLWVEFLGPVGGGAFFALGTVALSAALLFNAHWLPEVPSGSRGTQTPRALRGRFGR
jgi:hypothetical protein